MWQHKMGWLTACFLLTAAFALGALWPFTGFEMTLCSFKAAFGRGCPGCGMTRSVTALLHGDLVESLKVHLFGPIVAAVAGYFWIRSFKELFSAVPRAIDFTGRAWMFGLVGFLILYIGYWLVRVATDTVP